MYIEVISAVIGGIVAAITVYISNTKTMKYKIPGNINEDGYAVMKGTSSNKLIKYFCFIFGTALVCFSLAFLTSNRSDALLILTLGIFFNLMGLFFVKYINDNRIEYNDKEIKQYIMMRKKIRVIKWDELKSVENKNIIPFIYLKSNELEICVDLRFDGAIQFIQFLSKKVDKKYSDGLDDLLKS